MSATMKHARVYFPVAKPFANAAGCWAQVEVHIGQLAGAAEVPCQKRHRPGFLTCYHHARWERAAREHRDRLARKAAQAKEQARG